MKLISLYEMVIQLVYQEKPVDVIFVNFSKGFATVCHNTIVDKISSIQFDKNIMSEQLANGLGSEGYSKWSSGQ